MGAVAEAAAFRKISCTRSRLLPRPKCRVSRNNTTPRSPQGFLQRVASQIFRRLLLPRRRRGRLILAITTTTSITTHPNSVIMPLHLPPQPCSRALRRPNPPATTMINIMTLPNIITRHPPRRPANRTPRPTPATTPTTARPRNKSTTPNFRPSKFSSSSRRTRSSNGSGRPSRTRSPSGGSAVGSNTPRSSTPVTLASARSPPSSASATS
mmetsp:Transcript_21652/g.46317  ORF Transcript_21652/g.46317 Transcript_21652/m.46317 type:complete len:211 (+) Transcript_21652:1041-1673(+)